MRALVCGSEGFLMQAVAKRLVEAGHTVRGVDNFSRRGRIDRERAYEFVEGDLTDPAVADRVMRDVDVVFQGAAAAYGVVRMHAQPASLLHNDIVLHENVLHAAARHGVKKVVYISSSMLYEQCTTYPNKEDDPTDKATPVTAFGLSKLVGERLCAAYHKEHGLKYTIWRPFNIMAPGEQAEAKPGMAHVYADFIRKIVIDRQDPVEILGDGQQVRTFVWEEDLADGIVRYALDARTDQRTYNAGSPETVTILQLAELIHRRAIALGYLPKDAKLRFVHLDAPELDVRKLVPDCERARNELGWEAKMTLQQGIDVCLHDAMRAAGGHR